MSGRTQQENSKLKHVAQSCFKNRDSMINYPLMKTSIISQVKICKRSQISRSEARFFKNLYQLFSTLDVFIYEIHGSFSASSYN